ncbi:MAG TPA: nitroreductase family protein [Methylomusa anaerophila]|uniref:Putative NAD(P)H nitroreductase MhqN n=1 Tax=Methylomusa anaerophila TaxID=1930071 RepID=A0A348AG44_9FIRM|nr:nitroreductase family protein [Methylomusa anaerophila]BBB90042.1 putative NAD(P)H nitroreductase MhqN [Methylomusa anaerophila]HML88231.1 nitroreductase family protein [Methylomusa anaerophila]
MVEKKLDFKELAETRRSVNFFDPTKPLSDELLKDIIDLAVLAPSAFNAQPWQVLAVKSKEKRQEVHDKACNQPKVLDAPVLLAILGDTTGFKRPNPIWDEKVRLGNASAADVENIVNFSENVLFPTELRQVAFAASNSSLLAMSIMYAAKYYGVEAHPMIGFDESKIKEIFNIPDHVIVTMLICLGYFDETKTLRPRETRFTYEKIVKSF